MKIRLLIIIGTVLFPGLVVADSDWRAANLAIVNDHILPRYEMLAEAALALDKRSTRFCTAPDKEGLAQVRQAFHATMDGWSGVQHLRTGPIDLQRRYYRFQMWPDKHNVGRRQIGRLLAEEDIEALQADNFSNASVAIQGLSALEGLLFTRDKGVSSFVNDNKASYRCYLVQAIAHNLATMSADVVKEWRIIQSDMSSGQPPQTKLALEQHETAIKLFNDLNTQMQLVIDQKLFRPLGSDFSKARPRYLESWRSLMSLKNIILNLQALESLYDVGFAPVLSGKPDGDELDESIRQMFEYSNLKLGEIQPPLYHALKNEKQRTVLEEAEDALRILQRLMRGALSRALEMPQGFNSLDGD